MDKNKTGTSKLLPQTVLDIKDDLDEVKYARIEGLRCLYCK
jgi:hypothetical protein